jgi:hypothetical protein
MIVSSVLIPKGNPGNPEAPRKFYAQAKSSELTVHANNNIVKINNSK